MGQALISVIIPVYNVASYLREALNSVVNQSYENLEIIIVDDGSIDGSGSICDEYLCDSRVHVIHQENKGLSAARNVGHKKARGLFLLYIDSDDWIESHCIETLFETAIQTNADVVIAKRCEEYVRKSTYSWKKTDIEVYSGMDIISAFLEGRFGDVVWNKLYRLNSIADIWFPEGHNYEDVATTWILMKKMAKSHATIAVLGEELFHFRMRKSSISHTYTYKNIIDGWKAYLKKYETFPDSEQLLPSCYMMIVRMWINYRAFSMKEKKAAEKTIQEMKRFSKLNLRRIVKGRFSLITKIACIFTLSDHPVSIWLCRGGRTMYHMIRGVGKKMYE